MRSLSKKQTTIMILVSAIVLMVVTLPAAIWVTHRQTAQLANSRDRCQVGHHQTYQVVFSANQPNPAAIVAKLCDRLTFVNHADRTLLVAFGPHEHHVSYDGISERLLNSSESFTITLIKAGTYHFHDHITDTLQGTFTVNS